MALNVVVYNALPRVSSQQITVLLGASAGAPGVAVAVTDATSGEGVAAQIMPRSHDPSAGTIDRADRAPAPFRLVFDAASVGPLASRVFTITMTTDTTAGGTDTVVTESVDLGTRGGSGENDNGDAVTITNGEVTVSFSRATGLMSSITRHAPDPESWRLSDRHHGSLKDLQQSDVSIDVTQDMAFYKAWQPGPTDPMLSDKRDPHLQNLEPAHFALSNKDVGVDGVAKSVRGSSSQPAGAYIFRTQRSDETPTPIRSPKNPSGRVGLRVTQGDLVSEVVQTFSDWAVQTVRVRAGSPHVEVEWTVGEVPVSDGWGKEVISTIDASASMKDTGTMLYTDSNGREFMPRARDLETEEFVAGNYYPLSTSAYVKDEGLGVQMSVLVDRGEGCASLKDGAMELLLHRRLLVDDWRGVGESLNETTGGVTPYPDWVHQGKGITVRGTYAILVSPLASGMKELRQGMDETYLPAYPLFTPAARVTQVSGDARRAPTEIVSLTGGATLPINVHLLTLEPWSRNQLLVRLAHQFAVDEDPVYSQDATVDMGALLSRYTVKGATEMSLSANMERSEMEARRLLWTHTDADAAAPATSTEEREEEARRLHIFHKHHSAPNDVSHPPPKRSDEDTAAAAAAAAAAVVKGAMGLHGVKDARSSPGDPFHKRRQPPDDFPHHPPVNDEAEHEEGVAHEAADHDAGTLSRHTHFVAAHARAAKDAKGTLVDGLGLPNPFHKHSPARDDFPHPPEPTTKAPAAGAAVGRDGHGIRPDGSARHDSHGVYSSLHDSRPPPNDFHLPHRGDGDGGDRHGHGGNAHTLPSGRIEHGSVGDARGGRHLATSEAPAAGVGDGDAASPLNGDTHNDFPSRRLSGDADLTVTLTPMQVRTFIVDVSV